MFKPELFSAIVQELRDRCGSMNQLGHTARLSTPNISRIMEGKEPTYETVLKLARAFPDRAVDLFSCSPYEMPASVAVEPLATRLGIPSEAIMRAINEIHEGSVVLV